jgi:hypothetical protein
MKNNIRDQKRNQEVCKEEEERKISLPGGEILVNARVKLLELAISLELQVMRLCSKSIRGRC